MQPGFHKALPAVASCFIRPVLGLSRTEGSWKLSSPLQADLQPGRAGDPPRHPRLCQHCIGAFGFREFRVPWEPCACCFALCSQSALEATAAQ